MRSRKAAEAAKKGRREDDERSGGGKGCSELGTEIHYQREAGKWDSLGAIITKWTSLTRRLELSIKVSANPRRILAGSRGTKAAVLLSPLARSRDGPRAEVAASVAEIESSVGSRMEMDHLHFLHPADCRRRPARFISKVVTRREIFGEKMRSNFPRRVPRRRRGNFF